MKITSHTARISQSEIYETPLKSLNNIITKVSKCAFAALIFLTTITTLISGAIAYPRFALKDTSIPTTTLQPLDSVKMVPIDQILASVEPTGLIKCMLVPNHSGFKNKCFQQSENDNWCTIL